MEPLDDIPRHFICPISLQPMQDPVTAPTGTTYDRRAIERWLAAGHATCPVTGHSLSVADLTPNHTLCRLIHSWHSTAQPAPPSGVAAVVAKLLSPPCPPLEELREAAALATEGDAARRGMVYSGVVERVHRLVVSCAKKSCQRFSTVEQSLALLHALNVSSDELRPLVADNYDLVDALTYVLTLERGHISDAMRANAVQVLESVTEVASAALLDRLKQELFRAVTAMVRDRMTPSTARSALRVLLHACPNGKNRTLIAEAGAAHEAIELELATTPPNKRMTELVMALLVQLCACADGRAAVAAHPAGIAVVAKRVLRVSAAADECAVRVLAAVGGRAAAPEVVWEMARVGAVGKLCCVLQADCDGAVKETARTVLRLHAGVWKASPCVSAYLLSRYP